MPKAKKKAAKKAAKKTTKKATKTPKKKTAKKAREELSDLFEDILNSEAPKKPRVKRRALSYEPPEYIVKLCKIYHNLYPTQATEESSALEQREQMEAQG